MLSDELTLVLFHKNQNGGQFEQTLRILREPNTSRNKLKNQTFLTTPSPSRDRCWPVVLRAVAIGSRRSDSCCFPIANRGDTRGCGHDEILFLGPGLDLDPDPDRDHDHVLVPVHAHAPDALVPAPELRSIAICLEYFSVAAVAESQPAVTAVAVVAAGTVVVAAAVTGNGDGVAQPAVAVVVEFAC